MAVNDVMGLGDVPQWATGAYPIFPGPNFPPGANQMTDAMRQAMLMKLRAEWARANGQPYGSDQFRFGGPELAAAQAGPPAGAAQNAAAGYAGNTNVSLDPRPDAALNQINAMNAGAVNPAATAAQRQRFPGPFPGVLSNPNAATPAPNAQNVSGQNPGVMFTGSGGGYSPSQSRQYNLPITMAQWGRGPLAQGPAPGAAAPAGSSGASPPLAASGVQAPNDYGYITDDMFRLPPGQQNMAPGALASAVKQPNWWQGLGRPNQTPGQLASAVSQPNWWQSLWG